eukprot:478295_1
MRLCVYDGCMAYFKHTNQKILLRYPIDLHTFILNKFSGRRLNFQMDHGKADVSMQFNVRQNTWTFKKMLDDTSIPKQALQDDRHRISKRLEPHQIRMVIYQVPKAQMRWFHIIYGVLMDVAIDQYITEKDQTIELLRIGGLQIQYD